MDYWVITAAADHAATGVDLGIVQACHGKVGPLRRMRAGDGVVIYSSKHSYPAGAPLQAFTAIGHLTDAPAWQVQMAPGFVPWRWQVAWQAAVPAPIRPLLPELELTRGLANWGMVFRFGLLRMGAQDFALVAGAMQAA